MGLKLKFRPFRLGPPYDHILAFKAEHDTDVLHNAALDSDFHSGLNDRLSVASVHGRFFSTHTRLGSDQPYVTLTADAFTGRFL